MNVTMFRLSTTVSRQLNVITQIRRHTTEHMFSRYSAAIETFGNTDPRADEVYRLRYNVMSTAPGSPFNASHPQVIDDCKIRDELDCAESTIHYAIRCPKTDEIVAAIRTVDANKSQLDMERYGWFDIPEEIKAGGAVEWGRLIVSPKHRKTNSALRLYVESVRYHQDHGIDNVLFMVDSRAVRLMKYYKRYTICEQISEDAVPCDEFEVGRKSYVMNMPFGATGSLGRINFYTRVEVPILGAIACMKTV